MRRICILVVGVVIAAVGTASPASADASDHASCLGVTGSLLSGSPGARAVTAHGILSISPEVTGQPPGAFYKTFAHRHPGGPYSC